MRPGPPESGAHGPDEIYDKFTVVKSKHVRTFFPWADGELGRAHKRFDAVDELTHKDEWIFVVRPETNDGAAVAAIEAYADACESTYPGLAAELRAKLQAKGLT